MSLKKSRKMHRRDRTNRKRKKIRYMLFSIPLILLAGFLYIFYGNQQESIKDTGRGEVTTVSLENVTNDDFELVEQPEPNFKTTSTGVRMISHQGLNNIAPAETLVAYTSALDDGYTELEGDVYFTKDNIPVLSHDYTINEQARNSDGSEILDELTISDLTLEELNHYDFGISFSEDFKGTKILTFEDFVKLAATKDAQFLHVELKNRYTKEQKEILYNIVYKYGFVNKVGWQSFYAEDFDDFNSINDTMQLEFLFTYYSDVDYSILDKYVNDKRKLVVSTWYDVTDENIQETSEKGYELYLFTIDDEEQIKNLKNKAVAGIMTNESISIFYSLN